jgi:hypothetical protein
MGEGHGDVGRSLFGVAARDPLGRQTPEPMGLHPPTLSPRQCEGWLVPIPRNACLEAHVAPSFSTE